VAKRQVKRCLALLIFRELQINITMKYHLTLINMTIIKKKKPKNKHQKYDEKALSYNVGDLDLYQCKLVQPLENSVEVPHRTKN